MAQTQVQKPTDIEAVDPALLVAFKPYYDGWTKSKHRFAYRDWALDSGAFVARARGIHIDLYEYIEHCKYIREADPTLSEIFSLDVIGDWRATVKNTEMMWAEGIEAIPCYHFADDNEDVLISLARDYPKIALGGMADLKGSVSTASLSGTVQESSVCRGIASMQALGNTAGCASADG
jgi:hypothetical protein